MAIVQWSDYFKIREDEIDREQNRLLLWTLCARH